MSKIQTALENIFKDQRIVFWYDAKQELRGEFERMEICGVSKIEVSNNQFGVKYRLARQEPDKKFLLYFPYARPEDMDNWLLDLLLANYEFQTDQAAVYLQELELGYEFKPVIEEHIAFCGNQKRLETLKSLINKEDQARALRRKMMAVVCNTEPDIEKILIRLFEELAGSKDTQYSQLSKFGLVRHLWEEAGRLFGYESDQSNPRDFVIALFKTYYQLKVTGEKPQLNKEAVVFINLWKDSLKHSSSFETLSNDMAGILSIEKDIEERDYKTIADIDLFKIIDQKLIAELKDGLLKRTIKPEQVISIVGEREHTHWYDQFLEIYQALRFAAQLLEIMPQLKISFTDLPEAIKNYNESYYKIDLYYRKFIFHLNRAGQRALLEDLAEKIEKIYSNEYLLPLNDAWQQFIDKNQEWNIKGAVQQREFFNHFVQPYIDAGIKVFVIISDALRYESGVELVERLMMEDRFTASLSSMIASIPSHTALGMASLLPHTKISYTDQGSVNADGINTQGTANRSKILNQALKGKAKAIKAEEFLSLNTMAEGRPLAKENDVVYIYHNGIDSAGDKRETEGKVFAAVESEFDYIIKILKQISNINIVHVLITADHGFIYQNTKLDESDYSEIDKQGDVIQSDRRFVIGKNLVSQSAAKKFNAAQLGLEGDTEFLIAKSINRYRVKGSGSRYVHGGASLQEIILPVIAFSKKRVSDVSSVEVDLIKTTSYITTGQVTLSFYQETPVEDKLLHRVLRAGFYSGTNQLISDLHTITFDSYEKDARNREKKVQFTFSKKSEEYNGQDIFLRMETPVEGTSHFSIYKEFVFTFKRSFTSDFDDF